MNCAVGCLLLGLLNGLMVILLLTRTVQVQEISQKSTRPQWPWVYRLDNGSYSTIQPPTYITYTMKIEEWPALFGLLDFFYPPRGRDYTTKFSPISKKVKWQPLDRI